MRLIERMSNSMTAYLEYSMLFDLSTDTTSSFIISSSYCSCLIIHNYSAMLLDADIRRADLT